LFLVRHSEAQVLTEERHHVVLKAIRHRAGVRALINLKTIRNPISIEDFVQLSGIDAQSILIPEIFRKLTKQVAIDLGSVFGCVDGKMSSSLSRERYGRNRPKTDAKNAVNSAEIRDNSPRERR